MKTLLLACMLPLSGFSNSLNAVINALVKVESRGITNAANGNAIGILQIKPIMVREVNRILRSNVYKLEDRYSPALSKDMAYIFFTYWIPRWPKMSDRELCGRWMMPNGKAPEWYKVRCEKVLIN